MFSNRYNSRLHEAEITWRWGDIGMKKNIKQKRETAKELTGIGDEAFTAERVSDKGNVEYVELVFRVSNLVVEVDYVNAAKIGDDAAVREGRSTRPAGSPPH